MNSRWLRNLHQRHKFLRAEASRDILEIRVSEIAFSGVFKMFRQNTRKTGNNAVEKTVEMFQAHCLNVSQI